MSVGQIPRPPAGTQPVSPGESTASSPRQKGRSVFGKVIHGIGWLGSSPVHWIGINSIRSGATFIGRMAEQVGAPVAQDPRLKTTNLGAFELSATAVGMGMTVIQVERHLASRRRQTAITAYLFGAFGLAFFFGWLMKVLTMPFASGRVVLAVDFLPLCFLFLLLAFYQALVNFQLRVGRTAGWREYLTTDQEFWPRT